MRTHRPAEHTVTEIVDNAKQRIEFQNPAYITIQNLLWVIENRTGIHNQHQRNVPLFSIICSKKLAFSIDIYSKIVNLDSNISNHLRYKKAPANADALKHHFSRNCYI